MTKEYYLKNSKRYIIETRYLPIDYSVFEGFIMPGSKILDLGCGSGRDSIHFSNNYKVYALDYIPDFLNQVKFCTEKTYLMDMKDFNDSEQFDAIWASESLIHFSTQEIVDLLNKYYYSLRGSGVMYLSFTLGDYSGMIARQYMTYMNEERFKLILKETNFRLADCRIYEDANNKNRKIITFIIVK